MIITEEDRKRFPHHTDGSIIGRKMIEKIPSETLKELFRDANRFEKLRLKIGQNTNPNWVVGVMAEVLYLRNEIDEIKFDYLSEYGLELQD